MVFGIYVSQIREVCFIEFFHQIPFRRLKNFVVRVKMLSVTMCYLASLFLYNETNMDLVEIKKSAVFLCKVRNPHLYYS